MSPPAVQLGPFDVKLSGLLARWLSEPHVSPWYPDPEDHLSWALSPPNGGDRAFILSDGTPVGYIRWQVVSREVLDTVGLTDIPGGAVDVDILIGEPNCVAKGIGPTALGLLLARLGETVPLVGLTTSIRNTVAQRAFQKAGFHILRRYSPPGYGECLLMVLTFRTGRDA